MPPHRGPTLLALGVAAALPLTAQTPATIDQTSGTTATLIGISIVSPTVVWVSGTAGTYLVTIDGGATWRAGVVPGADSLQFRDVHALDAETAWLLSAGPGEASRIYHTRDGGRSWTEQFRNRVVNAFFDCIGFWDRRRGIAVSDAVDGRFVMVRTEDGANWTAVAAAALPPAHAGEGMFAASGTCLALRGDSLAWLGTGAGNARVLRTRDAGRTWTAAETPVARDGPTRGLASVVFFDDLHGIALGGDVQNTAEALDNVAVTSDGGSTWTLAARRTLGAVYGAAAVPGTRTVVAVGPAGASWSRDGGGSWTDFETRNYWSVGFAADGTGWMIGRRGLVTRVRFGRR